MTRVLRTDDPTERATGLGLARDAVRRERLVVLPTDTVYGVAADAFSPVAVRALLAAKGRGRDVPVPVLVGSWQTVDGLVARRPPGLTALVEAFWPGALTVVVPAAPTLAWDLGDTRGTVALRMPLQPVALDLLSETGPLAVSSANRHGEPTARTADEAVDALGAAVAVALDAGPLDGVASTVVDLSAVTAGRPARVLREGSVPVDDLREVLAAAGVDLVDGRRGDGEVDNDEAARAATGDVAEPARGDGSDDDAEPAAADGERP